ncbi:ATP-dependent DNA helicase [Trichonephila inaurata madagascariensis]|uniref:ATP-dependent DNA helicase n=1 Tax=Trichonephila inaurata madagascariensis TaxID=2747483 RepID=A0A8X6YN47_9ARAC|nr:ATP-dependent DNA helicase [Trichonephila inaurata madagascariensis]
MTPHHALIAVDRIFRDLMGLDVSFGGKGFVLGDDWRQILPVAEHKTYLETYLLCPKNEDSLKIYEQVLARFPGQNATYFSAGSIISEDQEEQNNFQLDFINGITPSGMPPHVGTYALSQTIGDIV